MPGAGYEQSLGEKKVSFLPPSSSSCLSFIGDSHAENCTQGIPRSGNCNIINNDRLQFSNNQNVPLQIPPTQIFTPLMLSSVGIGLPPKFSGKNSDWFQFKTQWEIWVQTMSVGDGTDDRLILANLSKVLDDGEAANLLRLRNMNPKLSYTNFWKNLVEEKERFNGESLKQTLENLKLETKGKMTLSKCKEYTSNFQRIAMQLPSLTSEEAIRIILRQIPHYLATKLQNEASRKRKNVKVKISGLFDVEIPQLQALLASVMSGTPKFITKGNDCFFVELNYPDQKTEIESLHLRFVTGHGQINVTTVSDSLSIPQAMAHLQNIVETDEDLEETRRILGNNNNNNTQNNNNTYAVETNTAKTEKKKEKTFFEKKKQNPNTSESTSKKPVTPELVKPTFPPVPQQTGTPYYPFKSKHPGISQPKSPDSGEQKPQNNEGGKGYRKGGRGKGKSRGKGNFSPRPVHEIEGDDQEETNPDHLE